MSLNKCLLSKAAKYPYCVLSLQLFYIYLLLSTSTTMQVIYEITCNSCQQNVDTESKRSREPGKQEGKNYFGMTMMSSHCRMVSHLSGQRTKSIKNPLWCYDKDAYDGQHQQYTIKIMAKDKEILLFSIVETLQIKKQIPQTSLNEFKRE